MTRIEIAQRRALSVGRKTRHALRPTHYALQLVCFSLDPKLDSKCAVVGRFRFCELIFLLGSP